MSRELVAGGSKPRISLQMVSEWALGLNQRTGAPVTMAESLRTYRGFVGDGRVNEGGTTTDARPFP